MSLKLINTNSVKVKVDFMFYPVEEDFMETTN